MYKKHDKQETFFGNMVYDRVIPKDHFLKKLSAVVDFSFVNDLVRDLYCPDNGRPCWEPQLIFKALFLQFLYNLSDYDIEEFINLNLAFKCFLGLDVDESGPDHSTLSRFRDRLGAERFADIFNKIVSIARSHDLVSDKLHIVDATHVQAKVDVKRIVKEHAPTDSAKDSKHYIDEQSPDPDARFGKKSEHKPFYGYKEHAAMDAESEIVVAVKTTPGNENDHAHLKDVIVLDNQPKVITADKAYDCRNSHGFLSSQGIRNGIILRRHVKTYNVVKRVSQIARRFRCRIEHKFAEAKKYHSLDRARYLGLVKTKIQALMIFIAINCKRMVTLLCSVLPLPKIRLRAA